MRRTLVLMMLMAAFGCGNPVPGMDEAAPQGAPMAQQGENAEAASAGEPATPPFAVREDLAGLLLVWFDKDGLHTAQTRAEIPEGNRRAVRVASLEVAPDERLDAEFVYVADVRRPGSDGNYAVRKMPRDAFDALADKAQGPLLGATSGAAGDVVLYKASWCGACKAAEGYLKSRGVSYQAFDIEKDGKAAAEMQRKVQAAGKVARGVPVIDFKGEIMLGFDQSRLQSLIDG